MAGGLAEHAVRDPDGIAIGDGSRRYTRSELDDRTNRGIAALGDVGLQAGDAVAIMASNSAEWGVLLSATSLGGFPPVLVNTHLTADEVAYILTASGSIAVLVDDAHRGVAEDAARQAGIDGARVITALGTEWDDRLAAADPAPPPAGTPFAGTVYFTSGTTGRPKGTRMNMVPSGVPVADYFEGIKPLWQLMGISPATRHLVTGPLYHAGPQALFASTINGGGFVHVMPEFDAEEALALIEEHRIGNLLVVPTMFVRWLRLPDAVRAKYDVSSITQVTHTAAPCPPDVKRRMIEWWGPVITEGYGASEIGAVASITSEEWLERPGSVGKPLPMFALRIVDDDGNDLPAGEIGRVFAKGLAGHDISYLDEPDMTAAVHLDGGWFTLGDLGWLDDDGFLYLADRRVDVVITGGVNVYPAEVESALLGHPDVDDVAVFGIPDDEWGQQVKAAVQLRPGVAAGDEVAESIIGWARERMAHFKAPRSVDFHDQLPRHENGKLYKRLLRDAYWQEGGTT